MKKITFSDWITQRGAANLAKDLGVKRQTVDYWRRGHTAPRPELMKKILKISKGRIQYKDMIENYLNAKQ